jgi:hypothetical protein
MDFNAEELDELRQIAPNVSVSTEGGYTYLYIQELALPEGCEPEHADVLLCPSPKDGYQTRLFFSSKIKGCGPQRNWNGNIRALEKNWFAISWCTSPGLRLAEMLLVHLKALRA